MNDDLRSREEVNSETLNHSGSPPVVETVTPPPNLEVEIKGLVIRTIEPRLRGVDYSSIEAKESRLPTNAKFYIAENQEGVFQRCITIDEQDRRDVAALVGNWIASGLIVKGCDRKELIRYLRRAEKLDPSSDE